MKKFALAAVAAAAMTCGVAQAYTAGTYSNGVVVPSVEMNDHGTTAVGLINRSGGAAVPVFWVYHGQDSGHVIDGCFTMTDNEYKSVIWGEAPLGDPSVKGLKGYLVFAVGGVAANSTAAATCNGNASIDTSGRAKLTASAFQVDTSRSGGDVVYVPVIDGPLVIKNGHFLRTLQEDSLMYVGGAADVVPVSSGLGGSFGYPVVTARYAKGIGTVPVGNDPITRVTVWSTGNHSGRHTVDVFNDKQNRTSTNFELKHAELDHFDPYDLLGTSAFTDGFIEWRAGTPPYSGTVANGEPPLAAADAGLPSFSGSLTTSRVINKVVNARADGIPHVPSRPGNGNRPDAVTGSVFVYSTVDLPMFGSTQTILGATQP